MNNDRAYSAVDIFPRKNKNEDKFFVFEEFTIKLVKAINTEFDSFFFNYNENCFGISAKDIMERMLLPRKYFE